MYHNFHAPWNQHNRFLVAAPPKAKDGYRTLERMPPPPFGNPGGRVSPQSAGAMEVNQQYLWVWGTTQHAPAVGSTTNQARWSSALCRKLLVFFPYQILAARIPCPA